LKKKKKQKHKRKQQKFSDEFPPDQEEWTDITFQATRRRQPVGNGDAIILSFFTELSFS
jgi:hypothetical protein